MVQPSYASPAGSGRLREGCRELLRSQACSFDRGRALTGRC